jgi:hypothetical protein
MASNCAVVVIAARWAPAASHALLALFQDNVVAVYILKQELDVSV